MWLVDKWKKFMDTEVDDMTADLIDTKLPSVERLKAFAKDPVWQYINDTIRYRIKASRDDLEDQRIDIETVRVYQGRIEELRFVQAIPSFLIENYDSITDELKGKAEAKKE